MDCIIIMRLIPQPKTSQVRSIILAITNQTSFKQRNPSPLKVS